MRRVLVFPPVVCAVSNSGQVAAGNGLPAAALAKRSKRSMNSPEHRTLEPGPDCPEEGS
jgi:hypothetical protein